MMRPDIYIHIFIAGTSFIISIWSPWNWIANHWISYLSPWGLCDFWVNERHVQMFLSSTLLMAALPTSRSRPTKTDGAKARKHTLRIFSLVLQISCEARCLGTKTPLQNHLQKGLEHKGLAMTDQFRKLIYSNFKPCIYQRMSIDMRFQRVTCTLSLST